MWNADQWSYRNRFEAVGRSLRKDLREAWLRREFPLDAWRTVGRSGLFALLAVSRRELNAAVPNAAAAFEGFSKGSFDMGFNIPILVHAFMGLPLLYRHATPSIAEHLPDLMNGDAILAFAVTEPHGGSKAMRSECTLVPRDDGGYRLDGKKWHITNAPHCTHVLAWVRHPSLVNELVAVFLDADTPGLSRERIPTLAASSSAVGTITFDGVVVPRERIVHLDGGGRRALHELLLMERSLGMISTIGIMETMVERSVSFASSRNVGGTVIVEHQHIQRRISDMATRLETVRALSRALLACISSGSDPTLLASIAKMQCTRALVDTAIDAAQLGGTYGMLEEAQFPMVLLDSLGCTVGGGTDEVHRTTIVSWLRQQAASGQLYQSPRTAAPSPVAASPQELLP